MKNKIKVAVLGSTGYVGMELVKILSNHSFVDINFLGSETIHGSYLNNIDNTKEYNQLPLLKPNDSFNAEDSDYVFLALPHAVSNKYVKKYFNKINIIDLSADFRLDNFDIYKQNYGNKHDCKEHLNNFIYGLAEINREKILGQAPQVKEIFSKINQRSAVLSQPLEPFVEKIINYQSAEQEYLNSKRKKEDPNERKANVEENAVSTNLSDSDTAENPAVKEEEGPNAPINGGTCIVGDENDKKEEIEQQEPNTLFKQGPNMDVRKDEVDENLRQWFGKGGKGSASGGGWDRYNTKGEKIGKCGDRKKGEGKPKCLSKSVNDVFI